MDIAALIDHARGHYVEQLEAFATAQSQHCTQGSAEVKIRLSDHSSLFQHLYCVDFLKNDGEFKPVELLPARVLLFQPITGSLGAASVVIEHLRWDDNQLHHDAAEILTAAIAGWFETWFDPDDKRLDRSQPPSGAKLSGIIHSLLVQPGLLSIDLGSAPTDAFWNMLALIESAGASFIRVSSSRSEATATA